MKAVIIDDESKARNLLRVILEEYCSDVTVITEAEDLPSGIKAIHKINPDVVFLDVEMPGYAGTQILDFLDETQINFQIVFTTAYSDYALKAFELNAISYLLKPLRPKLVADAVLKIAEKKSKNQITTQLKELSNTLKSNTFTKIALPVSDGVMFVRLNELIYFKADGMYTHVFTVNNNKLLISKPLKYFVEMLAETPMFFRCHRSFLVNKNFIKQIVKSDGGYFLMENDDVVSASKEALSQLSQFKEI